MFLIEITRVKFGADLLGEKMHVLLISSSDTGRIKNKIFSPYRVMSKTVLSQSRVKSVGPSNPLTFRLVMSESIQISHV